MQWAHRWKLPRQTDVEKQLAFRPGFWKFCVKIFVASPAFDFQVYPLDVWQHVVTREGPGVVQPRPRHVVHSDVEMTNNLAERCWDDNGGAYKGEKHANHLSRRQADAAEGERTDAGRPVSARQRAFTKLGLEGTVFPSGTEIGEDDFEELPRHLRSLG